MFSSVQSLSHARLFETPWTAYQASLSFTICRSLCKLMSIELVMPSNHLILCHPPLLLPSVFLSIRGFSNELAACISHYFLLDISICNVTIISNCTLNTESISFPPCLLFLLTPIFLLMAPPLSKSSRLKTLELFWSLPSL